MLIAPGKVLSRPEAKTRMDMVNAAAPGSAPNFVNSMTKAASRTPMPLMDTGRSATNVTAGTMARK